MKFSKAASSGSVGSSAGAAGAAGGSAGRPVASNDLYESMTPLFWRSFAVHVVLLAFIASPWSFFLWNHKIDVEKSLRVDLVALPEILAKDQQLVPKKFSGKSSKNLKKQKKIDNRAFSKFLQKRRQQKTALNKDLAEDPVKGNVLSSGTHLKGIDKIKYDRYLDEIDLSVKQKFLVPEWLKDESLQTQVKIKINSAGEVVEKKIIHGSGNESYDQLVLRVIDEASPFPSPPRRFKQILLLEGLVLGFPE